jgi:hypothetical protein
MLKDATYKEKLSMLKPWMPFIIENVKKDLKNDHLKRDTAFCRQYLAGKNSAKATVEDLVEAYTQALETSEKAEVIAEFISHRWLSQNGEMYTYFAEKLSAVNPDFAQLEQLEANQSRSIVAGALEEHDPLPIYLFCVLNSVVFPPEVFEELRQTAEQHFAAEKAEEKVLGEQMSLESLQRFYEQKIARLVDKYEKKLAALQKKSLLDTESFKKQLALLQKKLGTS